MKNRMLQMIAVIIALSTLAGCGTLNSPADGEVGTLVGDAEVAAAADAPVGGGENADPHTGSLDYDESSVVEISLGAAITANSDDVSVDGTTATITSAGAYELSGTLADGEIIVDAGDDSPIQIILDDADITNADGAAISVMSAETAVVILTEGSSNTLSDGDAYTFAEGEDEPNATVFSTTDLTIGGTGSLAVSGNYNDGIASKDGLIISGGAITVDAVDDGIRGKDYLVIEGGSIEVAAGGDGLKADNDEDPDRGYITIQDGAIDVVAQDDGVQAATDVLIAGGTLDVAAGATGGGDDARAIVGNVLVAIAGGTITAEAADDAIHSNSTVTITDGDLTLASGDDAIHGDLFVTIDGGSILITESFEGIESEVITINDGFIDLTSDDDGLNVAGADSDATTIDAAEPLAPGTDTDAAEAPTAGDEVARPGRGAGGRPAGGPGAGDAAVGDYYIYINGGTTLITVTGNLAEQGDGIDANGHIEMTGGVVAISGATDTRNSAVDYSGGSFVMTGGLFVGTNIDGRNSEGIGAGSTQASLYATLGAVADAGTLVHVQSADGEGLVTFEPVNDFDVIVFSSPDLEAGGTYEVYLGGTAGGDATGGLYETYSPGEPAGTITAV